MALQDCAIVTEYKLSLVAELRCDYIKFYSCLSDLDVLCFVACFVLLHAAVVILDLVKRGKWSLELYA